MGPRTPKWLPLDGEQPILDIVKYKPIFVCLMKHQLRTEVNDAKNSQGT